MNAKAAKRLRRALRKAHVGNGVMLGRQLVSGRALYTKAKALPEEKRAELVTKLEHIADQIKNEVRA